MKQNGAIESFEIERKYEVVEGAAWPSDAEFSAIGLRLSEAQAHELRAQYFDTPNGDLARQRVAMRHRSGGKDEGWHLKMKGDDGARELLWPTADEMPEGLRAELRELLGSDGSDLTGGRGGSDATDGSDSRGMIDGGGGRDGSDATDGNGGQEVNAGIAVVGRIATLRTQRVTALLLDASGNPVVELADDSVDATNEITGFRQQWREWEAELMPEVDPALLDEVEPLLVRAGASRVRGTSKIQRTMRAEGVGA